jgi:2'-hydroxyisoflavone reductase
MRLLLLGGTRFVGRHVVEAALGRGHEVTIFTRGKLPNPWEGKVRALVGDRDPSVEGGMRALQEGRWDAVIDTSGYLPRVVKAGVDLLRERAGRYLFVSTISVYADASRAGLDENAPVAKLDDPASEDIPKHYGALKAACEDAVQAAFGGASLIVRPGLIVGPHDHTDRFAYWVARFANPALLGLRGKEAVVPEPAERPVQFIDARDLAGWMLDALEGKRAGTFNATSPANAITMGALMFALEALSSATGADVRARWVAEEKIEEAGVAPWNGLPLWIPTSDASMAGFDRVSTAKADAAGLKHRPLADTLRDTAQWLAQRDNANAWQKVITGAQETALLQT